MAQLPPPSAVGRKLSTRVCPSSRRRRSGSHIDALRSSSLGGRQSHSAAAPHMRTCQTPSRWRSSPVRACTLLAWCYQRPHQRPLAGAPERRDVRRSCPLGRTFLLLRLVAALRGSPSSLAGRQAIGQEWEPTCAPRRVCTHEPGPSSELRAPSSPSRRLALRIALASPADPRRSKRHRVAARSNFHREGVRSLPGLICSVRRRFAVVRITLIVRDCAAAVGGGKARSRVAHRCRTDLAAKHTNGRTIGRADRLQRRQIRADLCGCLRSHV